MIKCNLQFFGGRGGGSGMSGGGGGSSYDKVLSVAEDSIRYDAVETAIVLDSNGNILLNKSEGHADYVSFTPEETVKMIDSTLTHNHPMMSTFSGQDIQMAYNYGVKEIRAVHRDGYYSLKRNFSLGDTIPNSFKEFASDYVKSSNKYVSDVTDKIFAKTQDAAMCNKMVQDYRRNWLKDNASKYGWTYSEG